MIRFVTDLGDSLVIFPLALALLLWLAYRVGPRAAFLWAVALALCGAGTAALKIYLYACPSPLASLHSPSGHASLSTLVYGSLFLIAGSETMPIRRLFVALLGGGLILAIALSRVLLGAHTTLDVLIGLAIGGAALAAIGPACLRAKSEAGGIATVFVAIALALLVLHGRSISFERVWRSSGAYLQDRTGLCRP